MQSDIRRQSHYIYAPQALETPGSSDTHKVSHVTHNSSTHGVSTSGYQYLTGDLMKTTILTVSIILIELTLKLFNKGV